MQNSWKQILVVGIGLTMAIFGGVKSAEAITTPRLGMNYSFYKTPGTGDTYMGYMYHQPGVRETVKAELASLKKQGVQTIRFVVNHAHDWGLISSTNGTLKEPFRTNFQNYFGDIKESGIPNLIVFFGPLHENDPLSDKFNNSLLEENWKFMQDVIGIATVSGPREVTFDLGNEIGPNEGIKTMANGEVKFETVSNYIAEIWKRYVTTYGRENASFGTIAAATIVGLPPYDLEQAKAFDNLLTALKRAGVAMPAWYTFSLYSGSGTEVYDTLRYIDSTMQKYNASGAIRITESFLDNEEAAQAVRRYVLEDRSAVLDYIYWPILSTDNPSDFTGSIPRSPPYKLSAYAKYLVPSSSISCTPAESEVNPSTRLGSSKITINVANAVMRDALTNPVSQLCVSSSLEPAVTKLMNSWGGDNTTQAVDAPWIVEGATYTFSLRSTPTGSECSGRVLTSCTVKGVRSITQLAGDLNGDNRVDMLDYNLLVAGYGNLYTQDDYNNIKVNFGK